MPHASCGTFVAALDRAAQAAGRQRRRGGADGRHQDGAGRAGQRVHRQLGAVSIIGEDRVQEFLDKYDSYHKEGLKIAFIGHLQRNKVKYIADKVDRIESVDIPGSGRGDWPPLRCHRPTDGHPPAGGQHRRRGQQVRLAKRSWKGSCP